ncbi:MAG TPA: helix-turn-helix transcriptional regulator [Thermoanaerobaculia bacterium]|nr:helix-turn-helix transcriptional regulator [Thermoanaerobaculia bacterium]
MDIVLRLRELRRLRGMSQKDVALRSGIGEKSISSFETGDRVMSMKVAQLQRLLRVYGVSLSEFFSSSLDLKLAPWDDCPETDAARLFDDLAELPLESREALLRKFSLMVDTARSVYGAQTHKGAMPSHEREWQMLTSRN